MMGPVVRTSETSLWLWCPACDDAHRISINTDNSWNWNGNEVLPTIEPSILVTGVQWPESSPFHKSNHSAVLPGDPIRCHSFVRNGQWQYLTDSTHSMAEQIVEMIDLPEWFSEEQ
jgi:hypothetical protein